MLMSATPAMACRKKEYSKYSSIVDCGRACLGYYHDKFVAHGLWQSYVSEL